MVRHQGRSLNMLVHPNERVPIARLLRFLEQGEQLAHDCAKAQAKLAPEVGMRRFLLGQARQEGYHAVIFQGAIAWLAPRHLGSCPMLQPLERYRSLIEDAISRGDLAETLLAEQIILEGLGEAILRRIEAGLVKRDAPFGRLRRILLSQEEAHYGFGQRALARVIASGRTSVEALRPRGQEYLALTDAMVSTLSDLFESVDEDPSVWASDAKGYVPSWLTGENASTETP